MELFQPINYWAILVCGLISLGIGALWYSPMLLGKVWVDSLDKSEEELKRDFKPIKVYSISFVAQVTMAYILARILSYINATTPEEGIRIAFMIWLGFTATTMTVNMLFEGKKFKHFLVDSGYNFIVIILYGMILGIWH
ncbi:MAG: DUF1761 domain-containing protein [Bacteroidota bacterium]